MQWPVPFEKLSYLLGLLIECKMPASSYAAQVQAPSSPLCSGFSTLPRQGSNRLRRGGSVTLTMQFRDWGGMFMEHCHNTVHEDNAMLVRWEIDNGGAPFLRPLPTPVPMSQGVTFVPPDDIAPTPFKVKGRV